MMKPYISTRFCLLMLVRINPRTAELRYKGKHYF
nr:MAG TPA: hypothetical protein [Caudoviricetes sp.]DAH75764.1 MAG TPA: hypothetical protein [Caudoviricetes sp.]